MGARFVVLSNEEKCVQGGSVQSMNLDAGTAAQRSSFIKEGKKNRSYGKKH